MEKFSHARVLLHRRPGAFLGRAGRRLRPCRRTPTPSECPCRHFRTPLGPRAISALWSWYSAAPLV